MAADPDAELTVDLEAQVVHLPGDEDLPFEVDPFARLMLLDGTDEMGYLLGRTAVDRGLGVEPPTAGRHFGRALTEVHRRQSRRGPHTDDVDPTAATGGLNPLDVAAVAIVAFTFVFGLRSGFFPSSAVSSGRSPARG